MSSTTQRSDAAVRMKVFNVIEIGPNFVRKEGACVVLRWHETSRVVSQFLSRACVNHCCTGDDDVTSVCVALQFLPCRLVVSLF